MTYLTFKAKSSRKPHASETRRPKQHRNPSDLLLKDREVHHGLEGPCRSGRTKRKRNWQRLSRQKNHEKEKKRKPTQIPEKVVQKDDRTGGSCNHGGGNSNEGEKSDTSSERNNLEASKAGNGRNREVEPIEQLKQIQEGYLRQPQDRRGEENSTKTVKKLELKPEECALKKEGQILCEMSQSDRKAGSKFEIPPPRVDYERLLTRRLATIYDYIHGKSFEIWYPSKDKWLRCKIVDGDSLIIPTKPLSNQNDKCGKLFGFCISFSILLPPTRIDRFVQTPQAHQSQAREFDVAQM